MDSNRNENNHKDSIDLDSIETMDGHCFEELISNLLIKMGFITEKTKPTADGGIDINAHREDPILAGRYIIQCKRQQSSVGEPVIRDLYGVVTAEKANKGILITNSIFTSSAVRFAEDKPLELIDGSKLMQLFNRHYNTSVSSETDELVAIRMLFYEISKITYEIKTQYQVFKKTHDDKQKAQDDGLVFVNTAETQGYDEKTLSFIEMADEIHKQSYINDIPQIANKIIQFIKIMENYFECIKAATSSVLDDKNDNAKRLARDYHNFLTEFLDSWKVFYAKTYPSEFNRIRGACANMFDSCFNSVFAWGEPLAEMLDNHEKYNTQKTAENTGLRFDEEKMSINCKVIEAEVDKINKQQSNSANKGSCFIATACYGENSPEVIVLRKFRDTVLLKKKHGEIFVKLYYKWSPSVAKFLGKHEFVRRSIKRILNILVGQIKI